MATDPLHRRRARHLALAIGATLFLLSVNAAPSSASAAEEQQGARLLQSVQAGKQRCQQLSRDQFDSIGESVMGRMVGSTARHGAMNQQIRATTGASGEARAHVFMGQRFSGCATGAAPAAFGSMMGMMGYYSGANGGRMGNYPGANGGRMGNYPGANGGRMGNGRDSGNGFGPGMVGSRAGNDDGWSSTDAVFVILLGLLAAALAALAVWRRPWRQSTSKTPFDVLSDRYARGDIDTAEYEQRQHALATPA